MSTLKAIKKINPNAKFQIEKDIDGNENITLSSQLVADTDVVEGSWTPVGVSISNVDDFNNLSYTNGIGQGILEVESENDANTAAWHLFDGNKTMDEARTANQLGWLT